jgi:hypothetical protein
VPAAQEEALLGESDQSTASKTEAPSPELGPHEAAGPAMQSLQVLIDSHCLASSSSSTPFYVVWLIL